MNASLEYSKAAALVSTIVFRIFNSVSFEVLNNVIMDDCEMINKHT